MRKLFSLFAAMLVALAVNATVININTETEDALRKALASAQAGDEIVMAAGTYVESNSNYIAFDKSVTVRAEENAEVILQPKVPITISNGAVATIQNIKIDASQLNALADWYEHVIYPTDDADNELHLDGCEFYGFNINKSMIYCSSDNKINVCEINNCYFHNIMKSIVFFENAEMSSFSLTNSTVANIATVTDSYYAGVFDVRSTSGTCTVDHCTFYDVQVMNTDYAAVCKKSAAGQEGMVVSNCIFMLPASQGNIRAIRDYKYANNCLTYNYTKDSNTGIHSGVAKSNCLTNTDPLFVNAAEGNLTLGEGSPALTAGTDGSNLGDPRWWPAPAAPQTLYLKPGVWNVDGAKFAIWDITHSAWSEFMTLAENETSIYTATVPADAAKVIFVRLNGELDAPEWGEGKSWNQTADLDLEEGKDLYTITDWSAGAWSKYEYVEPAKFYITGAGEALGNWNPAAIKSTEDTYTLHLAAGEYRMKVTVDGTWDTAKGIEQLTTRADGLQDINGNIGFILAEAGDVEVTYTNSEFKLVGAFVATPIIKTYMATGSGWSGDDESNAVWNAEAKTITVNLVQAKEADWQAQVFYQGPVAKADKLYDVSMKLRSNKAISDIIIKYQNDAELYDPMIAANRVALEADVEYTFSRTDLVGVAGNGQIVFDFGHAAAATEIVISQISIVEKDIPEPTLANGYYLMGNINGVEGTWTIADLTADRLLTVNPGDANEYMIDVTLAENDELKVVRVDNDVIGSWYPDGEGNNYVVDADHAGEATVYFRPAGDGGEGWWYNCIYVEKKEPAAGCEWASLSWIGDGSPEQTFGNQFKVCVGDPAPGIVNIQRPGFAGESGIYMTFGSDLFTSVSLPEGKYATQGAGMVLYISAFTAKETEVTVVSNGVTYVFTVYNDKGSSIPTAIDNNAVDNRAVKCIKNGMLFIQMNGKTYNVLGEVVE